MFYDNGNGKFEEHHAVGWLPTWVLGKFIHNSCLLIDFLRIQHQAFITMSLEALQVLIDS